MEGRHIMVHLGGYQLDHSWLKSMVGGKIYFILLFFPLWLGRDKNQYLTGLYEFA